MVVAAHLHLAQLQGQQAERQRDQGDQPPAAAGSHSRSSRV
jgi:hypothetical protein